MRVKQKTEDIYAPGPYSGPAAMLSQFLPPSFSHEILLLKMTIGSFVQAIELRLCHAESQIYL